VPRTKPIKKQTTKQATPPATLGTSIGDAPMTITFAQMQEMQAAIKAANAHAAQLEAELHVARGADPSGRVESLRRLIRDGLMPIMRFAIANLPPDVVRNWPHSALEATITLMSNLPDFSEDDRVLICELRAFMEEVADADRYRRGL